MAESKVVRYLDVDQIYPIGSIYMSVNSTNPSLLFGGVWEAITDRFLLAAGTNYLAGSTGGQSSVALTTDNLPSHTHGSRELIGNINLRRPTSNGDTASNPSGIITKSNASATFSAAFSTASFSHHPHLITVNATHTHNSVGNNVAHDNMPPYLAVYVWKRTS